MPSLQVQAFPRMRRPPAPPRHSSGGIVGATSTCSMSPRARARTSRRPPPAASQFPPPVPPPANTPRPPPAASDPAAGRGPGVPLSRRPRPARRSAPRGSPPIKSTVSVASVRPTPASTIPRLRCRAWAVSSSSIRASVGMGIVTVNASGGSPRRRPASVPPASGPWCRQAVSLGPLCPLGNPRPVSRCPAGPPSTAASS